MDFTLADDFLEHLELHPNGSFVLVKRDSLHPPPINLPPPPISQPTAPPSSKIIINHHGLPTNNIVINNNNDEFRKSAAIDTRLNGHICEVATNAERSTKINNVQSESEEEPTILPEMLKNQIKIEPISEDEEEEVQRENHITANSFSHNQDAPQYNKNTNESAINNDAIAPSANSDPNQQLMVLSNPRIGDGPGEYLCNVCQAKFVYKNNLKSHLKRHLGIYP